MSSLLPEQPFAIVARFTLEEPMAPSTERTQAYVPTRRWHVLSVHPPINERTNGDLGSTTFDDGRSVFAELCAREDKKNDCYSLNSLTLLRDARILKCIALYVYTQKIYFACEKRDLKLSRLRWHRATLVCIELVLCRNTIFDLSSVPESCVEIRLWCSRGKRGCCVMLGIVSRFWFVKIEISDVRHILDLEHPLAHTCQQPQTCLEGGEDTRHAWHRLNRQWFCRCMLVFLDVQWRGSTRGAKHRKSEICNLKSNLQLSRRYNTEIKEMKQKKFNISCFALLDLFS